MSKAFPQLSKPQASMLAALSLGIAWAKSCTLTRVALSLSSLGTVPTVERRLQRTLSNQRLDWKAGSVCLARWLLTWAKARLDKPTVLLVDESALGPYLKVMMVALAYRGRALPLAWWCYAQDQYPLPQVQLIDRLLGQVAQGLPPGVRVLVQADRGLGCSPDLIQAVEQRGWYYLFRVQGTVRLRLSSGRQVAFRQVVPKPGRCFSQQVQAFKKAGWVSCRALGYWKWGQEEPWLLLSNWPEATTAAYAVRMWEEHAFRDLKSNGLNWQKSRVRLPEHANRLWLGLALACAWIVSLGTRVLEQASLWRQVAHGAKKRFSVFQLGLRLLERWLHLGKEPFYDPHLNLQFLP